MPLLELKTSVPIPEERREEIVRSLSRVTAEVIGKPEGYVMVTLDEVKVCMGGEVGPGAFVDVRSIGGLDGGVNKQLSKKVCALLGEELDIPSNRIYLNFTDIARSSWGWDGGTFG